MKINYEKCIGCGQCMPYCPIQAIYCDKNVCKVNEDLCYECGTCLRVNICPVDAIYENKGIFRYPRIIRKAFSDPTAIHMETTLMRGRGTQEVKNNDVSNRYKEGEVGILIEVGRPTIGTRLIEVEKVTSHLAKVGFNNFEKDNPVFGLFLNSKEGKLKEELLNERILSLIMELKIKKSELEKFLDEIYKISKKIDTVFTLSLITRYDDMRIPIREIVDKSKLTYGKTAKINIGVGRHTNKLIGKVN